MKFITTSENMTADFVRYCANLYGLNYYASNQLVDITNTDQLIQWSHKSRDCDLDPDQILVICNCTEKHVFTMGGHHATTFTIFNIDNPQNMADKIRRISEMKVFL